MAHVFLRLTLDDVARHKDQRDNVELDVEQITNLNESLSELAEGEIKVVAIENVARVCDVDLENSRRWQSNVEITCVVSVPADKVGEFRAYQSIPELAQPLIAVSNRIVEVVKDPDMTFSGDWVIGECAPVSDFIAETAATPKM